MGGRSLNSCARHEAGQATIEYILLTAIVLGIALGGLKALRDLGVSRSVATAFSKSFSYTYRYGHPKARGYDDGGPVMHPRITEPGNFRLFRPHPVK